MNPKSPVPAEAVAAPEGHTTFFRQGSWMIVATVASGVFMTAVHVLVSRKMDPFEYIVFSALLRVYFLISIPASGLQTVFAQQAAAAVSDLQQRQLSAMTRAVLHGTFLLWLAIAAVVWIFQAQLVASLKITNPAALWMTVLLGLAALWFPLLRGLLQGIQNFAGLGWVLVLDGVGRFLAIVIIVWLGGQAAGGMTGAVIGQIVALIVGVWFCREVLQRAGDGFAWRPWLRRLVPLTFGPGIILFMYNADVIFVQSSFASDQTVRYMPAAMIGLAMVMFTMPLSAVMFPKIVRSTALTQNSSALQQTLVATTAMGILSAIACTLLPKLPLQIIYFGNPLYWEAAPLVPWFAWALLPLILANVLIGNQLARERFAVVPWLVLVATAYGVTLWSLKNYLFSLDPYHAFRLVVQTLGGFNLLLLGVAAAFTWRERGRAAVPAP